MRLWLGGQSAPVGSLPKGQGSLNPGSEFQTSLRLCHNSEVAAEVWEPPGQVPAACAEQSPEPPASVLAELLLEIQLQAPFDYSMATPHLVVTEHPNLACPTLRSFGRRLPTPILERRLPGLPSGRQ